MLVPAYVLSKTNFGVYRYACNCDLSFCPEGAVGWEYAMQGRGEPSIPCPPRVNYLTGRHVLANFALHKLPIKSNIVQRDHTRVEFFRGERPMQYN